MRIMNRATRALCACVFCICVWASYAFGQSIPVYAGPSYDPSSESGYKARSAIAIRSGFALGNSTKYDSGLPKGMLGVGWDTLGITLEWGNLGTGISGNPGVSFYAANASGTAVGTSNKYVASQFMGGRAARWDLNGSITELGVLGTDDQGACESAAVGINSAGVAVGFSSKFDASGLPLGSRPVKWDPLQTSPTELPRLSTTDFEGYTNEAMAISDSGVIVGISAKYTLAGAYLGSRPVRWDTSGNVTELGVLSLTSTGSSGAQPTAINKAGTAVGWADVYDASGKKFLGRAAVRWDASATIATELGRLGESDNHNLSAIPSAINDIGTSVGTVVKYVGGVNKGDRAVRWDPTGIDATELQVLSTDGSGLARTNAADINSAGLIAGVGYVYDDQHEQVARHAIVWREDGTAIDLNSLIDAESGWMLESADRISDDNWVAGIGLFDPDGPLGDSAAYERLYMLQVPEPATLGILQLFLIASLRRHGKR